MKRRQTLKRKTPFKSRGRKKKSIPLRGHRIVPKGFKVPDWFRSIPLGSHGSNATQKRYWKIVSDLVRQRDFKKYRGKCVSCHRRLERWQDGQAAHFKPWSVCHSYFKWEITNIAFSCAICNQNSGGHIGHAFGEELKKRYGEDHLLWISEENERWRGVKLEDHVIVERVQKLMEDNPEYIYP